MRLDLKLRIYIFNKTYFEILEQKSIMNQNHSVILGNNMCHETERCY